METLLVIDDEPGILLDFRRAFPGPEPALLTASSAREGLECFDRHRPEAVVLGLHLADSSGPEILRRLRERDPDVPVLVVAGAGSTDSAIEAIKLGAFDYLLRPLEPGPLRGLIGRALQVARLARRLGPAAGRPPLPAVGAAPPICEELVGCGPAMQGVYKAIGRVAPSDVTVLILGESGTGKELVARALHQHGRRASGPFLAINCAAIPEGLLESELFGHEEGAFTGADRRRLGKFEQAGGGTLFLDEIGDLAPMAQAKVLRALQDRTFERVGGSETIRSDVRLIAATHRDLRALARDGRFREDLFYRLSVFRIELPPLRDRLEDLPALVEHFLRRDRLELGKDVLEIAPEALDRLRGYAWPGNIRELQSVLKRAVLHSQGPTLLPDFLPPLGDPRDGDGAAMPAPSAFAWERFVEARIAAGSTEIYTEAQAMMEREIIARVLRHTEGNQLRAARLLGITRGTLRTKIRSLGIPVFAPRRPAGDPAPGHPRGSGRRG